MLALELNFITSLYWAVENSFHGSIM